LHSPATNLHIRRWSGGDVNLSLQRTLTTKATANNQCHPSLKTHRQDKTKPIESYKIVDLIMKHKTHGINNLAATSFLLHIIFKNLVSDLSFCLNACVELLLLLFL
jgi:hypothetical protein